MAAAVTSSISHQIPPISMQHVPRIRPPAIPKGTPSPNSLPQPPGPVPHARVWVQGKWRDPSSNATKDRQRIQNRQVEKALRRRVHGMKIYAYTHMQTNQVVYSLTRNLQNNRILNQLVFHGKKTVPAALRRDMWRPYLSIHFSQTPVGAQTGLIVYQQLRELAMRRQLSPPKELLMTTPEDVEIAITRKGDPISMQERLRNHTVKIPNLNQMLPKRLRAKKLMDQKASSVADVAFVLGLINEGLDPEQRLRENEKNQTENFNQGTQRARRRLRLIREKEEIKNAELEKRESLVERVDGNKGQLLLDSYTSNRLSWEYQGVMSKSNELRDLGYLEEAKESVQMWRSRKQIEDENSRSESLQKDLLLKETAAQLRREWQAQHQGQEPLPKIPKELVEQRQKEALQKYEAEQKSEKAAEFESTDDIDYSSRDVTVLWADLRDGTYAESWSGNVFHGELEPRAVSKRTKMETTQFETVDDEENLISEQRQLRSVVAGSSVHVIGSELGQWVEARDEFLAKRDARRASRDDDVNRLESYRIALKIRELRRAGEKEISYLRHLEDSYPQIKAEEDRHDEWVTYMKQRLELAHKILSLYNKNTSSQNHAESQDFTGDAQGEHSSSPRDKDQIFDLSERIVRLTSSTDLVPDAASRSLDANNLDRSREQAEILSNGETAVAAEQTEMLLETDPTASGQQLEDLREQLLAIEKQFPEFSEMEQQQERYAKMMEERSSEIDRLQVILESAKDKPSEETTEIKSTLEELLKVQEEDEFAMSKVAKGAERRYRKCPETTLDSNADVNVKGPSGKKSDRSIDTESDRRARRRADADRQALRDAGIETEGPRKSIWTRIRGIFGR